MALESKELKNILEAGILSSELPVTLEQMNSMFEQHEHPGMRAIEQALEELKDDYATRGIQLKEIDKGYRFHSREQYAVWLQRLFAVRPRRYSRALMETLSIIAFRQPVTRGDIENIRGVTVSTELIRTLLDNDWIRKAGHKQVPGRPALYGTTSTFLEYFGLESLADLPALEDEASLLEQQSDADEHSHAIAQSELSATKEDDPTL